MILALLGTQRQPFDRFVNELMKLLDYDLIYLQTGYNDYGMEVTPLGMGAFKFVGQLKLEQLYEEADLIITHAGTGSIMSGLYKKKKVLAIPRLAEFGEHVDDHQLEICKEFAKKGYIKYLGKDADIVEMWHSLKDFEPVPYESQYGLYDVITNFITKNEGKKKKKKVFNPNKPTFID